MIYIVQQLTQRQTAADKREFVNGYLGADKISVGSVVGGIIAGWLLTGGIKK